MVFDNNTPKSIYINLLDDILQKKSEVLRKLVSLTEQQVEVIDSPKWDEEEFRRILLLKEELIEALTELDNGFQQIYERTEEDLRNQSFMYHKEIDHLKTLITEITDISVKLQAMELRNKVSIEVLFKEKRREIKNVRMNNKTVTNYYKTINSQQDKQSYFYDKKK